MTVINLNLLKHCFVLIYCTALLIEPDDPVVLMKRADTRGHLGQRDSAIEDYRRAIKIQSSGQN